MARYPLNLPQDLKTQAELWAKRQGVSLNQFILWATAEKIGSLNNQLDDPAFPAITYRRGASGMPTPILRGTGIRVQTLLIAHEQWEMSPQIIAEEYNLTVRQVEDALGFAHAHRAEIESQIDLEADLVEQLRDQATE